VKEIKYKEDNNYVELTGTIKNLPDYCKYIPRPLISFDLQSFRRMKNEEEDLQSDENRIIVFDDEEFHKNFHNGERILIKGELQSRNYTRDNHEVDEIITMAVKNYIDIWSNYPTQKKPKGKKRQLIDWNKLLEVALIPSVPEDSIFKENGEKDHDGEFIYRIDEDGEVFKETQHVAYEIVAVKYEKLNEELDFTKGDKNKAVLLGKVTKQPYFDYLGQDNKVAFCSFNIGTKSKFFEGRMFYNNVITWSELAQEVFEHAQYGDYVKIVGRLQSRSYQKEIVKRWKTPSGRRKKKSRMLELTTREISATKVEKVIFEKQETKED
jgi:single-stranded DNA-binding protein